MSLNRFATAFEAQEAFYAALQAADLSQMMTVWAEDDDIVCIHPGGSRHAGINDVRESWRRIFSSGPELKFELLAERTWPGRLMSVHSLHERISHVAESFAPTLAAATNIYVLTERGWRMMLHHASPLPGQTAEVEASPTILH